MTSPTAGTSQPGSPTARQFLACALAVAMVAAGAGKLLDPGTITQTLGASDVLMPKTALHLLGLLELLCAALLTTERTAPLASPRSTSSRCSRSSACTPVGHSLLAPLLLLALSAPLLTLRRRPGDRPRRTSAAPRQPL